MFKAIFDRDHMKVDTTEDDACIAGVAKDVLEAGKVRRAWQLDPEFDACVLIAVIISLSVRRAFDSRTCNSCSVCLFINPGSPELFGLSASIFLRTLYIYGRNYGPSSFSRI